MKNQIVEMVQDAASGKIAAGIAVTTATAPAWISFVKGDAFSAGMMIAGAVATIVLAAVNIQAIKNRSQQHKLDTALKRGQLKEMGINPDTI